MSASERSESPLRPAALADSTGRNLTRSGYCCMNPENLALAVLKSLNATDDNYARRGQRESVPGGISIHPGS